MCKDLNFHDFHITGESPKKPVVGFYIHNIRIPVIKGWMSLSKKYNQLGYPPKVCFKGIILKGISSSNHPFLMDMLVFQGGYTLTQLKSGKSSELNLYDFGFKIVNFPGCTNETL